MFDHIERESSDIVRDVFPARRLSRTPARTAPARRTQQNFVEKAALAAVAAGAVLTRTHQVSYNFDGDEVFSANIAIRPFAGLIAASLADKPHPPLYNFLLTLWMSLLGASEPSLRAMSILFSLGALPLLYAVLVRHCRRQIAVGVLALYSLSPYFVYYGAQARTYSLISFLVALNFWTYDRLLDRPWDRWRTTAWAAASAVLIWSQFLGILLLGVEAAALLHRYPYAKRHTVTAALAAVLPILPWILLAWPAPPDSAHQPTLAWIPRPTWENLAFFYLGLFGAPEGLRMRWVVLLLASVAGGCFAARRQLRVDAFLAVCAVMTLAPPVIAFTYSHVGQYSVFAARQLMSSAVAAFLLLGMALNVLPQRFASVSLALLLAWAVAALPSVSPSNVRPPWRAIASQLDEYTSGTPLVSDEPWVQLPLRWYLPERPVMLTADSLPARPFVALCRASHCATLLRQLRLSEEALPATTWVWHERGGEPLSLNAYDVR